MLLVSFLSFNALFALCISSPTSGSPDFATAPSPTFLPPPPYISGIADIRNDTSCCHIHGLKYNFTRETPPNSPSPVYWLANYTALACQSACRWTTACQAYAYNVDPEDEWRKKLESASSRTGNCVMFYEGLQNSRIEQSEDQNDGKGWWFSRKYCNCFDYCYTQEHAKRPFGDDDRCW